MFRAEEPGSLKLWGMDGPIPLQVGRCGGGGGNVGIGHTDLNRNWPQ